MSDERLRNLEHAAKLSIARQLVDDIWKGAEGCAIDEAALRDLARTMLLYEKQLRESVVLRAPRARKDSAQ